MTFADILRYGFPSAYLKSNGEIMDNTAVVITVIGIVLCCIIGYLLGSINFAIIISKKRINDDVREHGSKNAGATNMLRTYGKKYALLTVLGDFFKSIVACFLGGLCWGFYGIYLAGLFCVLGHIFPIFFKLKGGKGVATIAGVMCYGDPGVFLILFILYFAIVIATKYVSLASIMCAALYPFLLHRIGLIFNKPPGFHIILGMIMSAVVIAKHSENIKRLMKNSESKLYLFGKKKHEQQEQKEEPEQPKKPKSLHNDD